MLTLLAALRTRVLPALLTALGVVLITAGLLSYADPTTAGTTLQPSPTIDSLEPTPTPDISIELPSGSLGPSPSASPGATPTGLGVATRVVIPALKIDLAVVKGPDVYPYCNVAMYLVSDGLGQPGEGRATYLFAHARDGMFGPIYELAHAGKQRKMLGMIVQVYTSDDRLFLYEVHDVRLHQLNLDAALGAKDEELWLQTSEGPKGTPGKTQVRALLLSVGAADPKDAHPKAKPVSCG